MTHFWLEKHLHQWRESLSSDRKPQAVILSGEPGMGKSTLLKQIIADLLCRKDTPACGECQNCRLNQQGHHPDVDRLVPENNLIKVKMIRSLTDFFVSTPHCSDHKLAVIESAHLMNPASANALLKVLEEPPTRGLLFLVTDSKHRLMPTIKSRCISLDVHLDQSDLDDLANWLQQNISANPQSVNDALLLCDHQPFTALKLLESEQLDHFKNLLDVLHAALIDQVSVSQVAKHLNDHAMMSDWMLMQRYWLQLLKTKYNAESYEVFADHPLNQIIKKSPKVVHIIIKITELIQQFMLNLNTQIKTQLLLESMLVEIKSEVNLGS